VSTSDGADNAPHGFGWVIFSTIMLSFIGIWGMLEGILAITSPEVFEARAAFVFSNINTWGWIVLALGFLCMVASVNLMYGSEFARWFGIFIAGLNALGHLMVVNANPWWSMAVFSVDILIIYGLVAHGEFFDTASSVS